MPQKRTYFIVRSELEVDPKFGPAWEVRYHLNDDRSRSFFFASCGPTEFGKENADIILKALTCDACTTEN